MGINNSSEKVSVNRKKVIMYLTALIVSVLVVLLILSIVNAFKYSSTNPKNSIDTVDESIAVESDKQKRNTDIKSPNKDFANLVSSNRTYNPKYGSSQENFRGNSNTNTNTPPVSDSKNPYQRALNNSTSVINGFNNTAVVDPLTTYKQQERLRSITSHRASWKSKNNTIDNKNRNAQADQGLGQQIGAKTIEEKRRETRAKIEESQNKLAQLTYYQSTGQMSKFQKVAQEVNVNDSTFKAPPVDIVGYSKENTYQADVKGKYKIPVGTVIPAFTTMKTMSDYQGTFKAMIDHDIYDITDQYILLPKGTEFLVKSIKASNVNEAIENRMGYTVTWAILPNGNKIDFSKSNGLDLEGIGAVKDEVNYHFMAQFLGVSAYALISSESSRGSTNANSMTSYAGDVGQGVRDIAKPLAQKYINIVPTITINAGTPIRIIIEDEMYVNAWRDIYAQYY